MMSQRNDTPGTDPEGEATAPADLLQMWIAGRDAAAKSAEPAGTAETAETPDTAETAEPAETPDIAEPAETPDHAEPAGTGQAQVDPGLEAPGDDESDCAAPTLDEPAQPDLETSSQHPTARGWWPSSPESAASGTSAARPPGPGIASVPALDSHPEPSAGTSDDDGSEQATAWWPYTEPEAPSTEQGVGEDLEQPELQPDQDRDTSVPSVLAAPGPDGLHEDVESEWSPDDAPSAPAAADSSAPAASAPDAPGAPLGPDGERGTGGWASFGAAQTAEDVLDKLGSRSSWTATGSSRPLADLGPRSSSALPDASTFDAVPAAETPADSPNLDSATRPVDRPTDDEATSTKASTEVSPEIRAAEPTDPEAEAGTEPSAPAASFTSNGPDLSATTHWSLDDFESYIKAQGSNEFASWLATKNAPSTPLEDRPETTAPETTAPETTVEGVEPLEAAAPESTAPEADAPDEVSAHEEPEAEAPSLVTSEPEPLEPSGPSTFAWTPTVVSDPPVEPIEEPDAQPDADADSGPDAGPDDADSLPDQAEASAPQAPAKEPKRGLLARLRAARDEPPRESEEAISAVSDADEAWAEHDVEWDDVDDSATDLPAQPAVDGQEALFDPASTDGDAQAQAWDDPDATQHFDVLNLESLDAERPAADTEPDPTPEPVLEPLDSHHDPAPAAQEPPPSYSPGEPTPPPSGDPAEASESAPATREGESAETEPVVATDTSDDAADEDHQEWFDDHGLRWVSSDGGYTWFSDDGQGWNAEIGEPIDVPPDRLTAARGDAAPSHASSVTEQPEDPEKPAPAPSHAAPQAAPLFRDEVHDQVDADIRDAPSGESWSAEPGSHADTGPRDHAADEAFADEVWPSTSGGDIPAWSEAAPATEAMWPGEAPEALPATQAIAVPAAPMADVPDVDRSDTHAETEVAESATAPTAPGGEHAALEPEGTATPLVVGGEEIPPFVEYKPRGAYRPLLGVLFAAAAILAVVAIFWAVSRGSQAATGIAAGVTGFALAFWWGLLSWTPTIVSLSGSVLEVARGSDGERFDLRSPQLMIDVDDDPGSRNWRTTITRPNGTELVIPASAVDPTEFAAIVKHYRAEAEPGAGPQVRGR